MNESPETRLSLIARLHQSNDSDAWLEFVRTYEPLILTIAQRRGLQHADAAEVTQEVLKRVASSIETWDPDPRKGAFRGWLYRVTRNLTIDYLRHHRRWRERDHIADLEAIPTPSDDESQEFRLEFERQLFNWAAGEVKAAFKPDNWQAFWLTAVENKSVEVVSEHLNLPRSKVYVARSRVMARIAKVIQQRLEETENL